MTPPLNKDHHHPDDGVGLIVALMWVVGCVLFVLVAYGVLDGTIIRNLEELLCDGTRFVCEPEGGP